MFKENEANDSKIIKYQTFRVSSKTKVEELQEICQNFWDIKPTDNPHFFFTDEEIVIKLTRDKKQDTIEKMLKEMNNTKKTYFVLSFDEKLSRHTLYIHSYI
jgi:hypothetical protein